MFFGIVVRSTTYFVGAPCYMIPFFSNIYEHLEKKRKGSRFPRIMGELYDGILPYEYVSEAMAELDIIERELRGVSANRYIYDFVEPNKQRPEGMKINYGAVNLYSALINADNDELLPRIRNAFTYALYAKENVWLGDSIMGGASQKRPYAEEDCEHFVFIRNGEGYTLDRFFGTRKTIVVPESKDGIPVTAIGEKAFADSNVEDVTIPSSVRELCAECFHGCGHLLRVTIGENVDIIGSKAFRYCFRLPAIELPKGLHAIEDMTFSHCSALTEVVIPDDVGSIGDEAFADCEKLSVVTIPASVIKMSTIAFKKTKKHLTIIAPTGSTAAKYAKKYKIEWHE